MGQIVRFRRRRNAPQGQRPQRQKSKPPWLPLGALLVIAAIGLVLFGRPQTKIPVDDGEGIVARANLARVVDGDSIDIGRLRIRLEGIDAPELAQQCADATGRVYDCGQKAALALEDLVRNNIVRCARRGVDQYGRTLAVCTAGSIDMNAAMVESGNAVAYRENSLAYVPNEDRAKEAKRGLWAGSFKLPKDYRRETGRGPE